MRQLNVKLALILIVSGSLVLAGVFLVHYLQASRIANAFLWHAQRAEEEDRPDQVANYLKRYLEFRPHDIEERAHLGRVLASDRLAVSARTRENALFVLEPVIAREPDRMDLRRLVVRLSMAFTPPRLEKAKEHLDILEKALPDDGEVAHYLGELFQADKKDPQGLEKAVQWYTTSVEKAPERIATYVRLAGLLREPLNRAEQADGVMDDMVRANAQSFRAYLFRGRYHLKNGSLDKAGQDLERARELALDDADVLLALADLAGARSKWEAARADLQRGLERFPKDARFYQARSRLEVQAGQRRQAVECLRQGVNVLSGQAQADLLWTLANLLIDDSDWTQAEAVVGRLSQTGSAPTAVQYLQGRILLGREDWSQAARLLERARFVLGTAPDLNKELLVQVDLSLGQCYDRLNEPTRQLEAFRRVVEADQQSVPGRLGMAAALRALGQTGEAIKQYQQLADLPQAPVQRWIELARLQMERILVSGLGEWKEVEEALQRAERAAKAQPSTSDEQPEAVELVILRTQILVAQDKVPEARQLLANAWEAHPKQTVFGVGLAEIEERQGHWEEAWALLDSVARQAGSDSVEVALARARYWANRRSPEAGAAVVKLGEHLDQLKPDDQARLLEGLGDAAFRLGELKDAERFWSRLAELPRHSKDLHLRLLLFDLALQAGDEQCMQQALEAIRNIEGSQGVLARYGAALRLIWLAKNGHKEGLEEARGLLDQVAAQRPTWPAVALAKAEIATLTGNPEQAILHYRSAMSLGDHSPRVVRPLVQVLYQCQRFSEADQEIRRLQKQALSGEMSRLAAELSLRTQDPVRAERIALDALKADSTDYRDFLWVGQILAASGRNPQEAEQKLRRAVALGEAHAETWVALVQFLVVRDRKPDAQAVLDEAQSKLPPDQAPLALAQCQELLGRLDQAQNHYRAALAAKPDEAFVLRSVAGFFMRTARPHDAEPLLRKVLARQVKVSDHDVSWARRGLAVVLAAGGGFRQLPEALALVGLRLDPAGNLVEDKPLPPEDAPEEQRARARVLASFKLRSLREKAIALLEELRQRHALSADDQFLLVQLHEAAGSWPKACEHVRELLASQGRKPLYVAHYAQGLLHEKKLDEARAWIAELEKWEKDHQAEPGSLGSVDLRVLAYRLEGKPDDAVSLLKAHVTRSGAKPEEIITLIGLYGRLHRLPEALKLCEQCWKTCPPDVASAASLAVLRGGKPADQQCAQVEDWLNASQQKNGPSTALLLQMADLQDLRGRYKESAGLYRKVLELDPKNVVALNNLAWLLALKEGRGEEQMINQAIESSGARPELLDTSAVVYLALRQPDKAIAALERAANLDTPTGTRYFHLARAYQLANNPAEAAKAFRKAKELGLQRTQLHPVEQIACGAVFDALDRE
jgi:tetratricopeptide (TPR) repeat protein